MFMPSGVAASAAGVITETPTLGALSSLLSSVIVPSAERPIIAVRFQPNGDIEEATGDTSAILIYTKVGTWLNTGVPDNPADWQVRFSLSENPPGDAGTWFGSSLEAFHEIDFPVNFTWQKDDTTSGTAENVIDCTLRQISNVSNIANRPGLRYIATIQA